MADKCFEQIYYIFSMKFPIAVALVALVAAHDHQKHEKPHPSQLRKEPIEEREIMINQPNEKKESHENKPVQQNVDIEVIEDYGDWFGPDIPEKPFYPDQPQWHESPSQRPEKGPHHGPPRGEHPGKGKHDKHGNRRGKMNEEHHKRRCLFFGLIALVFTLFGVLLGRCCGRRCNKNRREQCRRRNSNIQRNSAAIQSEIQEEEKKIKELKEELENKRNEETRIAEESRARIHQRNTNEYRMMNNFRAPQVSESPNIYYHPQVPQNGYYGNVPVGRPLNESTNSSFAQDYPQL